MVNWPFSKIYSSTVWSGERSDFMGVALAVWFLDMRTLRSSVSKLWRRTESRCTSFDFGVNIGKNPFSFLFSHPKEMFIWFKPVPLRSYMRQVIFSQYTTDSYFVSTYFPLSIDISSRVGLVRSNSWDLGLNFPRFQVQYLLESQL